MTDEAIHGESAWRRTWRVLRYTPLSDLAHGELSARLDPNWARTTTGLPDPLAGITCEVARRARLSRRESRDVTAELVAHFSDGLVAGQSPDELAASFGSPAQAALLIRRARLRCRPWPLRALRFVRQSLLIFLGAFVVVYLLVALRFAFTRPTITHNFLAELNKPARAIPAEDRAWPEYRRLFLALNDRKIDNEEVVGPPSKHFREQLAWLARNRELLPAIRAAAARTSLGFVPGDAADSAVVANSVILTEESNPPLYQVLLPFMETENALARLLTIDAYRAAEAGDGQAAVADLTALAGMGGQTIDEGGFLVSQLVGVLLLTRSFYACDVILAQYPDLLDEQQLRDLAHRISSLSLPAQFEISSEIAGFDDLLQRAYSDNGSGQGYLTREGVQLLGDFANNPLLGKTEPTLSSLVETLILPGMALGVAPRRAQAELFRAVVAEQQRECARPMWQWEESEDFNQLVVRLTGSSMPRIRYMPVYLIAPAMRSVAQSAQRILLERDAMLVTLAIHAFRRQHSSWPASLAELVPRYLPAVPADRFDGQPLRYRLVDGEPRVYSVGQNLLDEGGTPADENGTQVTFFMPRAAVEAQRAKEGSRVPVKGDWVFFPPRPQIDPEDAEQAPAAGDSQPPTDESQHDHDGGHEERDHDRQPR